MLTGRGVSSSASASAQRQIGFEILALRCLRNFVLSCFVRPPHCLLRFTFGFRSFFFPQFLALRTALPCCGSRLNRCGPIDSPHVVHQRTTLGVIINSHKHFSTTSTLFCGSRIVSQPSMTNCSLPSSSWSCYNCQNAQRQFSVRDRTRRMQCESTESFGLQNIARILWKPDPHSPRSRHRSGSQTGKGNSGTIQTKAD